MPGFHLRLATPLSRGYELCIANASKFQDGPPTWTNIWTLLILLLTARSFVNHCSLF